MPATTTIVTTSNQPTTKKGFKGFKIQHSSTKGSKLKDVVVRVPIFGRKIMEIVDTKEDGSTSKIKRSKKVGVYSCALTRDLGREICSSKPSPILSMKKASALKKKNEKKEEQQQITKHGEIQEDLSQEEELSSAFQWNATNVPHFPKRIADNTSTSNGIIKKGEEKQEREAQLLFNFEYTGRMNIQMYVNYERTKRSLPLLKRRHSLDQIAKECAMSMAQQGKAQHSEQGIIPKKLGRPSRRLGENVAKGWKICDIHNKMMEEKSACNRNNILDARYTQMGTGIITVTNGAFCNEFYVCEIFRA